MTRMMTKLLAATVGLLVGGSPAFAMICGSGGASFTESTHTVFEHACYEFYFNNAGSAVTSGSVVVYDYTGTGVNLVREVGAGRSAVDVDGSDGDVDNVGTYITTTTTADSELVVGIVDDDSCADQTYCRVQVFGSRLARCAQSTDLVVAGDAVGTSTVAGEIGDAANDADGIVGIAFQSPQGGRDNTPCWIAINPSVTDG